jgi:hypothetical protein
VIGQGKSALLRELVAWAAWKLEIINAWLFVRRTYTHRAAKKRVSARAALDVNYPPCPQSARYDLARAENYYYMPGLSSAVGCRISSGLLVTYS